MVKKAAKLSKAKPAARKLVTERKVAVERTPVMDLPTASVLDSLWSVVLTRREADPSTSHSARLLSRGRAKVAQKFGEEAVECLIEAVAGNRAQLIAESADVLYHLLVMWVDAGILPHEVWAELERRQGVSGIAEKASRASTFGQSRKIP
jgi:phosphoribosyl-ATP pyrophosphohydrolase